MKLKLKFVNSSPAANLFVELTAEQQTYGELRKQIESLLENKLSLPGTLFDISLNGKDALVAEWNTNLKDLGIVSGDIVRIISEDDDSFKGLRLDGDEPTKMTESNSPARGAPRDVSDNSTTPQPAGVSNEVKMPEEPESQEEALSLSETKLINRHLNEPMLCRESTNTQIPSSLLQAYVNSSVADRVDAMIVVLNVLMSEAGLIQIFDSPLASKVDSWKSNGNVYNMRYSYASSPDKHCQLTCFTMGNVLVINGLILNVEENSTTFTTTIEISKYILADPAKEKDPVVIYGNLSTLSQKFKDIMVYPMLSNIQISAGFVINHQLMSLPVEVKMLILTFLDCESLLRLQSVCKELNSLCNEQCLWKRLLLRDFPQSDEAKSYLRSPNREGISWKELYRKALRNSEQKKRLVVELRRQMRNEMYRAPEYSEQMYFGGHPPPGLVVIGGEYDRLPHGLQPGMPGIPRGIPPGFRGPRFDPVDPLGNVRFPGAMGPRSRAPFRDPRMFDPIWGPGGGGGFNFL